MLDKEITSAELNEQLLNDVLERNYYSYFRKRNKQLSIIVNKGNICGTHCEVNNNFDNYFQVFDLSKNESNIKNLIMVDLLTKQMELTIITHMLKLINIKMCILLKKNVMLRLMNIIQEVLK